MNLWFFEIVKVINGEFRSFFGDVFVKNFLINSKNIEKDILFIFLKGSRFDGYDFIKEVL